MYFCYIVNLSNQKQIMKTVGKVNVRGTINALNVGDEPLKFDRSVYVLSSIRATTGSIIADTGKRIVVSVADEGVITVTRIS